PRGPYVDPAAVARLVVGDRAVLEDEPIADVQDPAARLIRGVAPDHDIAQSYVSAASDAHPAALSRVSPGEGEPGDRIAPHRVLLGGRDVEDPIGAATRATHGELVRPGTADHDLIRDLRQRARRSEGGR